MQWAHLSVPSDTGVEQNGQKWCPGGGSTAVVHLLEYETAHQRDHSPCYQRQPCVAVQRYEEATPGEADYPPGDHQAGPHHSNRRVDGFIDFGGMAGCILGHRVRAAPRGACSRREGRSSRSSKAGKGKNQKKIETLLSEIGFVEVELERYQRGMTLFRSKGLPKVGRWGKPETSQHGEAAALTLKGLK